MSQIKESNIKNCTYCFFNGKINIKNFDPNRIKINKKPYKNISIYFIGYIAIKDHLNIHSVNSLYFIIDKMDGSIEKSNGCKYLIFAFTEVLTKYTSLSNKTESIIEAINGKPGYYDEKYI